MYVCVYTLKVTTLVPYLMMVDTINLTRQLLLNTRAYSIKSSSDNPIYNVQHSTHPSNNGTAMAQETVIDVTNQGNSSIVISPNIDNVEDSNLAQVIDLTMTYDLTMIPATINAIEYYIP